MKYVRLKNLVVLVTAAAYFATFLEQKMKLRLLREKLLIISQRFFGIPPFRFYALADGIKSSSPKPAPAHHPKRFPTTGITAWLRGSQNLRNLLGHPPGEGWALTTPVAGCGLTASRSGCPEMRKLRHEAAV
jgi:hypothetical protein